MYFKNYYLKFNIFLLFIVNAKFKKCNLKEIQSSLVLITIMVNDTSMRLGENFSNKVEIYRDCRPFIII